MSDIDQAAADPNQNFVLRGSVGVASITGTEHVYFPRTAAEETITSAC